MRDIFLLMLIFGMIPVVLLRPHVGALLWAWTAYMNPHRLSWGAAYDFPLAMVIGLTTIVALLISRERKIPPGDAVTVMIVIMAIWVSVTAVFAVVPDDAFKYWDRTMKLLLMTVITIMVVNTRERIHALVWTIVVSLGFYGAKGGLFTIISGSQFLVLGPPDSYLGDNNSLSLALVMLVPYLRYLQLQSAVALVRLGLYLAMILCLVSVVGSYSRGALVGAVAMLMVIVIKSRRRGLIIGTGLVIVVFAVALTPERWIERMESIGAYEQDASVQGRFDAWTFAYRLSLDRPIVGGGFGVGNDEAFFQSYVPDAPVARSFHSIIFEMLGEHGYVGLALFLVLIIMGVTMARKAERQARDRPDMLWARDLAAMCQVAIVGFAVTGLFQDHAFFDLYYHTLAVIAVTWGILKRETAPAPGVKGRPLERGETEAAAAGAPRPGISLGGGG